MVFKASGASRAGMRLRTAPTGASNPPLRRPVRSESAAGMGAGMLKIEGSEERSGRAVVKILMFAGIVRISRTCFVKWSMSDRGEFDFVVGSWKNGWRNCKNGEKSVQFSILLLLSTATQLPCWAIDQMARFGDVFCSWKEQVTTRLQVTFGENQFKYKSQ